VIWRARAPVEPEGLASLGDVGRNAIGLLTLARPAVDIFGGAGLKAVAEADVMPDIEHLISYFHGM
jgi:hypothetical protein